MGLAGPEAETWHTWGLRGRLPFTGRRAGCDRVLRALQVCGAGRSPASSKTNPACVSLGRTLGRTGRKREAPASSPRGPRAGGAGGHSATRRSPGRQVADRQRARGRVPCSWAWSDQHDHPMAVACGLEASPASSSWESQWAPSAGAQSVPGRAHGTPSPFLGDLADLPSGFVSLEGTAFWKRQRSGVRGSRMGGRAGCEPRPVWPAASQPADWWSPGSSCRRSHVLP